MDVKDFLALWTYTFDFPLLWGSQPNFKKQSQIWTASVLIKFGRNRSNQGALASRTLRAVGKKKIQIIRDLGMN